MPFLSLIAAAVMQTPTLESVLAGLPADASRTRIGPLTALVGQRLLGVPYVGGTLDRDPEVERCTVLLGELDCVTFAETAWGIARAIRTAHKTSVAMDDVRAQIQLTRYRGGKLDGYLSRLHYTSDWMLDNAHRGSLMMVGFPESVPLGRELNFMSTHADSYAALKAHPELVAQLAKLEKSIPIMAVRFLPKDKVAAREAMLEDGDIVGIVTEKAGLDTSHVGLIVREGETARFMHASSTQKKVVLDGRISEYLSRSAASRGLLVARPQEP